MMSLHQTDTRIGILVVELHKVSLYIILGGLVRRLIFQDGVSDHLGFRSLAKNAEIFLRDTGAIVKVF